MNISLNVIKIGSHRAEVCFGERNTFLVRTHINLPNSLVQKWGKEYLSMRNFEEKEIIELSNNCDENRFITVSGELLIDRFDVEYLKLSQELGKRECEYWLTTFTGIDFMVSKQSLIPVQRGSLSRIFTVAFNRQDPKMFEATAILQAGDIVKMGSHESVFCPKANPFLNVWNTGQETNLPEL